MLHEPDLPIDAPAFGDPSSWVREPRRSWSHASDGAQVALYALTPLPTDPPPPWRAPLQSHPFAQA
jgi:hypothetical protein